MVFRGSIVLSKVAVDKIFLTMSNMYFYNRFREMHVDFRVAFHLIPVLDFDDVFPVRDATV